MEELIPDSTPDAIGMDIAASPNTLRLIEAVLGVWPAHIKFLRASFGGRSLPLLETTETIAALLIRVVERGSASLDEVALDYRYLCEQIVAPEELYFRREGRYRLSTFEEAAREVYDKPELMGPYMNGLFVSDALWVNHASAMNDFAKSYLPEVAPGGSHLEIGPGHGMLLHLATMHGAFRTLTAWDVSATSIKHTKDVLGAVSKEHLVDLHLQDLYDPASLSSSRGRFDTIVLSEVLEHLERPAEALEIIRDLLTPGGTVWINVPANGPAPDHLFLLRSLQEAVDLVGAAGLVVRRATGYPVAGASLERAQRQELPISCVIVASKPD